MERGFKSVSRFLRKMYKAIMNQSRICICVETMDNIQMK